MPVLNDDLGILGGQIVLVPDPEAMSQTKHFEGFRSDIYKDSVGKKTVGYGFNVDDPAVSSLLPADVVAGKRPITKAESDQVFGKLYERAQKDALDVVGENTFLSLPPKLQNVVTDMSYNMGRSKLAGFKKAIGALQEGDYHKFGEEIKDSKWFAQVGDRSKSHYQTVQEFAQKKSSGKSLLSSLNPIGEAQAAERVNVGGLDLEDDLGLHASAHAATPKLKDDLGILPKPPEAKHKDLHDLLAEDAATALRPLSPENVESIKAGLLGAGEIALSRTDLYKDPEVKELLEEHPIAKKVGETARDLALLLPIGRALEGVAALPFIPKVAAAVAKAAEGTSLGRRFLNPFEATRYVTKAVHTGATFGTLAAIKEAGIERPDQTVINSAQNIVGDTLWGAGLGLATAAPNYLARVATAGTYGGVTTALNGGSPLDIALNTTLFSAFELIGGKSIDRKIKLQAIHNIRMATADYLQKGGMEPMQAFKTADIATNNSIKAAGGLDEVLGNNSAPFMNQMASEMKKMSPTWEIARPKFLPDATELKPAQTAQPPAPVAKPGPAGEAAAPHPYLSETDQKDIVNLMDWESSMPNGEKYSFINNEGMREFGGQPSGHSASIQEFGPKASFELLKKAAAGEYLTDGQKEKVNTILEDYRTNIKPGLEATLQEIGNAHKDLSEPEAAEVIDAFKEEAGVTQYDGEGNIVEGNQGEAEAGAAQGIKLEDDLGILSEEAAVLEPVKTAPKKLGGAQASAITGNIDQYEPAQNTPGKQEAFKLSERVVGLVKKYAERFGENYNPSNTEGAFFPKTENIFVKAKNDVGVAAHEVTHYLDKKIGFTKSVMATKGQAKNGNPIYEPSTKRIRTELTDIYLKYYPGAKKDHPLKKRIQEGVAVFFQRMVTHPVQTLKDHPGIYRDFMHSGGKYFDSTMPEFVKEGRAIVEDYQKLSDLDKIGARVVDAEVMKDSPFLNIQETAIYKNIDNKYPLEKLAKEGGVHFTKNDPSLIARIYDHLPMLIQHNISDAAFIGIGPVGFGKETYLTMNADGEIVKKYDFNWHTLIEKAGANLDDFNSWLVARRVALNYKKLDELKKQFLEKAKELEKAKAAGIDPNSKGMKDLVEETQQVQQDMNDLSATVKNDRFDRDVATRAYDQHKDRFKDLAKMFDDLVKADLELARSADLISMKRAQEMLDEEGYATFKRQIENEIVGTGEGVDAPRTVRVGKNKISSLFKYGGSGKDIISPVYSSMVNHQEIMKKSARQIVYNKVGKIADKFPDVFQKVPLKSYKEEGGRVVYPQDKDPNIMMAYHDGRRVPYVVNKDLKTMIDTMLTPATVGLTEKIFVGLAQAFTKGTTAFYYPFAATNFVIDQLSAASNSWTKFKPIYTPIAELVKALSNRQSPDARYAMEYFMLGGERQAFLSFADLNPKEAYDFIRQEKNGLQKAVEVLNSGGDILSTPVKVTELLTRMSEFIRARKQGYSQLAALELAGRISTPFHHRGQKGDIYRFLTRAIPYLNASIQVLAQEARTIKNPKTRNRALFIIAAISAAMVAGVVSILNSTKEQKNLLKSLTPDRLARFIFLPSPNGETLIKIRVPQEMGAFATVLNMAIIDASLNAKYSAYEYMRGATGWLPDQLNPTDIGRMIASWFPQAVAPAVQVAFNKKIYPTIRDLEPDYMKYLPKDERVFETSSRLSKWLGPKLGLSPIQFDALIEGYTGRSLRYISGRELGNPFEEKMYLTASRQLIAFYAERAKNDENYQRLKDKPESFSKQEAAAIHLQRIRINSIEQKMKDYRKVTKENKNDPALKDLRTKILDMVDSL